MTLHLLEWAMTNGVKELIERVYSITIPVPFDIEMKIGASWADAEKWDWSAGNLKERIIQAITNHKVIHSKNKQVQALDPEETFKHMKLCYVKQCRKLKLHERYPLNY